MIGLHWMTCSLELPTLHYEKSRENLGAATFPCTGDCIRIEKSDAGFSRRDLCPVSRASESDSRNRLHVLIDQRFKSTGSLPVNPGSNPGEDAGGPIDHRLSRLSFKEENPVRHRVGSRRPSKSSGADG